MRTHYWRWNGHQPSAFRGRALDAFSRVITDGIKKNILFGPDGYGAPTIGESEIAFNGNAGVHEDMETFSLTGDLGYCKTMGIVRGLMPYDDYVTACLLVVKCFWPKCRVTSDGGADDWRAGEEIFERVTGLKVDLSFLEEK